MSDMSARILGGRYELRQLLGAGGMAEVYLAEDLMLHRPVAIKLLRPELGSAADFVARFKGEAQASANLTHPNIVSIYDVGEDDGTPYIVMEYVEGRTLKDLIREKAPLPFGVAVSLAVGIAAALVQAHRARVVHRDIKPENILLTTDGRVKVTDFGIARAVGSDTLVHTRTIIGSAHYFSPEQARGAITNEKTDQYALGVVLYEMVTGKLPFEGDSPISVAVRHVQEQPLAPRKLRRDLPVRLDALIMRLLEKDPARRFPSTPALFEELQALLADLGGREEGFQLASAGGPHEVASRPKRRGWVWGAVVGLLIAVGVGAGVRAFYTWLDVPVVRVPRVIGISVADATHRLTAIGLVVHVRKGQSSGSVPKGDVLLQSPHAFSQVRKGRIVDLVPSTGLPFTSVPRLLGMSLTVSLATLDAQNLHLAHRYYSHSTSYSQGTVMRQVPNPGTRVKQGSGVQVWISEGPPKTKVAVPNLVGESLSAAETDLASANLNVGNISYAPSSAPVGTVLDEHPSAATKVTQGTSVNLVVSPGPSSSGSGSASGNSQNQTLLFTVPANAPPNVSVKVVVADQNGVNTVYQGVDQAGQTFAVSVSWVGTARVEEYLNQTLVLSRSLPISGGQSP